MTKAKCTAVFLQCLGYLIATEIITASSVSFNKNGHIAFECSAASFVCIVREGRALKQLLTTAETQRFLSGGSGLNQQKTITSNQLKQQ